MALIIQCDTVPLPPAPPSIDIPHFGTLAKAWEGLYSIPKASDLLAQFQDQLAVALAPVRRYLELIEILTSLYACTQAIPKAILWLNPSPIYDCIENLAKAIARILSWVPPMAYIRMYMDLANYCISLIDEILDWFGELDDILTDYIETFLEAELLDDQELQQILECSASDIRPRLKIAMNLLAFVKPINDMLINVFIRLIPDANTVKALKKAKKAYEEANEYMELASAVVDAGGGSLPEIPGFSHTPPEQHQLVPVPPLGPLLYTMTNTQNAMVLIYNALAPLVGLDPDKEMREMRSYNNF
jgi:hypothetical protein